ncbi:MAG: metallophosphoesterase [Myxococcales bacterium]|nr:metallophosphoesterase [Myxococcales bacterium]
MSAANDDNGSNVRDTVTEELPVVGDAAASGSSIFAIGDVHGCASELNELLNKLPISSDSTLVFLGDYIDRGPESREVIDTILDLRQQCNVVTLLGNHEAMLLDFLAEPRSVRAGLFIYNGGSSTLASYANENGNFDFPPSHVEFFRALLPCYETERYFFCHAGAPEIPLAQVDFDAHRETLIWSRSIMRTEYRWNKTIVHGHSPRPNVELLPWRINVDTGCGFRGGALSAIELPTGRVFSVPRSGVRRRVYLRDLESRRRALRFRGGVPVRVKIGARVVHYETVDYSEIGMLMRGLSEVAPELAEGDVIEGEVGPQGLRAVGFRGKVVRRVRGGSGAHYGVEIFTHKPAEQELLEEGDSSEGAGEADATPADSSSKPSPPPLPGRARSGERSDDQDA